MIATQLAYAETLGVPLDIAKAAFMLTAAFPTALCYRLIPAGAPPAWKHSFSIVSSGALFCTLFDVAGFAQFGAGAVVVWAFVKTFRTKRWMPVAVFSAALAGLSANHIVGQLVNNSTVSFDHTAPLMVLVIKLSSYAWAAYDGTRKPEDLSEDQRNLAIRETPSLLEFMGYTFFFGGFLVGPSFEFVDYKNSVENKPPFTNRPSSIIPTLKAVGAALACAGIFYKYGDAFSYHKCLTPEFMKLPMWSRVLFMQLAGGIMRLKYYSAWKLSEGACDLAGIGWNGYSEGKPQWDRVQNIDITKFETAPNPKKAFEHWNKNTGLWLRRYVYLRITDFGVKSTAVAAVLTYTASGFWHGFRPGFYLTFLTGSFLNITGRTLRRNVRPLFLGDSKLARFKPLYDLAGWALTIGSINYLVAPFVVHSIPNSLAVWRANNFMLHIGLAVVNAAFAVPGLRRVVRRFGASIGAVYPDPCPALKPRRSSGSVGLSDAQLALVADVVDGAGAPALNVEAEGKGTADADKLKNN
ncbi:lysophospholipid acyltransferase [Thoreauomyces humboldtii]|nr:lysophospholipid acyltransferase [Thoreauomyces humboldtii]